MIKFLDERKKGEEFWLFTGLYKLLRFLKKRFDGRHVYCENIDNGVKKDEFSKTLTFDTKEECVKNRIQHMEAQLKISREHLMSDLIMYHYEAKATKRQIKECLKELNNG